MPGVLRAQTTVITFRANPSHSYLTRSPNTILSASPLLRQVECIADVSCGSWTWYEARASVERTNRRLCVLHTHSVPLTADDYKEEAFAISGPKNCRSVLGVPFHGGIKFPIAGLLSSDSISGLPIANGVGLWRLASILRAAAPPLVDPEYFVAIALDAKFTAVLAEYDTTLEEDDALLSLGKVRARDD